MVTTKDEHAKALTDLESPGEDSAHNRTFVVERVQTGVRMQKQVLKVLKALAEYLDISLGDLIEGIVLHAFDGRTPFNEATREQIVQLKKIYGLDLDHTASHHFVEAVPQGESKGEVG
ncbi:MAG TPA: hypothetical protein VNW71_15110 [Thermoanaerobaculia bacterium]|nr:hypothetical protein [Thermoanaerobaculia bacterium]